MTKKRYGVIDAVRGFSLILMIAHHFAFDLYDCHLIPGKLLFNPIVEGLHIIFASVFIAISGACSSFSSNNLRRGLKILLGAAAVTAATYIFDPGQYVRFGILHFLGVCSLLYVPISKTSIIKKTPIWVFALLFALTYKIQDITVGCSYLFAIGLKSYSFVTFDWFPLIPWIFMYLFGAKLGGYISSGKMPEKFYSFSCPALEWIGKKSLWIYLLHQPILLGITMLIEKL